MHLGWLLSWLDLLLLLLLLLFWAADLLGRSLHLLLLHLLLLLHWQWAEEHLLHLAHWKTAAHWGVGCPTVRGCIVTPPKWTPLPLPHLPISLGPRRIFMFSMSKIGEDMCLSARMPSVDKVEKSQ